MLSNFNIYARAFLDTKTQNGVTNILHTTLTLIFFGMRIIAKIDQAQDPLHSAAM